MKRFSVLFASSALAYVLAGCAETPAPAPASTTTTQTSPAAGDHGHDHPAHGAGPHGGTLTDWGGGAYHVEFTVDHDKKEATVYILGSDEKTPAPIKAEKIQIVINDPMTELELVAQPLEGEADGASSRFVGTHDTIGIVKEFAGTVSGQIEGTPYTGDFKEEPHGADHKH
jgi:hypothetical protein